MGAFTFFLSRDVLSHVAFGVWLLSLLYVSRPVYVAFRRRHSGYGVVFNSVTGIPEPLVSVRLTTVGTHGRIVSTAITDRQGRYRLTAQPGEYLVEAVKEGFVFPSRYLRQQSPLYENLLPSAHVIIKDHGIITKNIPIDPEGPLTRSKAFRRHFRLGSTAQNTLAYGSPFALVLYPLMRGSLAAWALFWGYVAIISYRLFTYTPAQPTFGTVTTADTHEPVERAVVRIFSARFNKLLETQVTGPRGRYAFVVHPGSYYVTISKPGYRVVRLNFPAITKDGFALAKDVKLTRNEKSR